MINCALVYGFDSPEHDVSVMTALEIMRNAPSKGIRLKPVYARDGRFFGGDELSEIKAYTPFEAGKHPEVFVQSGRLWRVKRGKARAECELDCALIAAHGGAGENGALQGFLEVSGVGYLSTGVFGAALGMSKWASKTLMKAAGVPVPEFTVIKKGDELKPLLEKSSYPVIIKPDSGGSSLGIRVADSEREAVKMVDTAFGFGDKVIIEEYLKGAEDINIAVLSTPDTFIVSKPERPLRHGEILSFDDKYTRNDGKISEFPVDLDEETAAELKEYVKIGVEIFEVKGVARFDFLLSDGKLYFNEVNTVPGSLAGYLFPEMSFSAFLRRLIEGATCRETRHFPAGDKLLNIKPKRRQR